MGDESDLLRGFFFADLRRMLSYVFESGDAAFRSHLLKARHGSEEQTGTFVHLFC